MAEGSPHRRAGRSVDVEWTVAGSALRLPRCGWQRLSALAVLASYLGKRGGCTKRIAAEHLSHAVWSHRLVAQDWPSGVSRSLGIDGAPRARPCQQLVLTFYLSVMRC